MKCWHVMCAEAYGQSIAGMLTGLVSPGQCGQSTLIEGMEIRVEKNSGASCVRPYGQ